jgi:hypothetical protein
MTDQYSSDLEKQNEELQQRLAAAEKTIVDMKLRIHHIEPYCMKWGTIVHAVPSLNNNYVGVNVIRQSRYVSILPDTIPYIINKIGAKRHNFREIEIMCTFCDSHVWSLTFSSANDDMWKLEVEAHRLKDKVYGPKAWRNWKKHFDDRAKAHGWAARHE